MLLMLMTMTTTTTTITMRMSIVVTMMIIMMSTMAMVMMTTITIMMITTFMRNSITFKLTQICVTVMITTTTKCNDDGLYRTFCLNNYILLMIATNGSFYAKQNSSG